MAESLIRASGISLGANGVGLVQLRSREGLLARRSGRQEEGRRKAAAAGAVEAAVASIHVERVDGALSLHRRRSTQRSC
jgi:hypothetical protein